jgi:ATP-binding cassette subfamily B (MDR/TAP) protein 1
MMAPGIQAINHGRQAAVDVFDTIKRKPEIDGTSEQGMKLDKLEGAIEFQDVTFAYPTRPLDPVFTKLNLSIKPGSSITLTGPSGSGKSSLRSFFFVSMIPIVVLFWLTVSLLSN